MALTQVQLPCGFYWWLRIGYLWSVFFPLVILCMPLMYFAPPDLVDVFFFWVISSFVAYQIILRGRGLHSHKFSEVVGSEVRGCEVFVLLFFTSWLLVYPICFVAFWFEWLFAYLKKKKKGKQRERIRDNWRYLFFPVFYFLLSMQKLLFHLLSMQKL